LGAASRGDGEVSGERQALARAVGYDGGYHNLPRHRGGQLGPGDDGASSSRVFDAPDNGLVGGVRGRDRANQCFVDRRQNLTVPLKKCLTAKTKVCYNGAIKSWRCIVNTNLYNLLIQVQHLLHKQHMYHYHEYGPFADPMRGQGRILSELKATPNGINARELADKLGILVTSLNETLAKLEKAELIVRVQSEADGRVSIIKLTGKAHSEPQQPDIASFLNCLTEEEKSALAGYLERLIAELQVNYTHHNGGKHSIEHQHHTGKHHGGHNHFGSGRHGNNNGHGKQCPCPNTECENHGKRSPGKERHHEQGGKTFCEKLSENKSPEKSGDVN
jgi:DNA-binding MarR family transcriptional regulator